MPKTRLPTRNSLDYSSASAKQVRALRQLLADVPKANWMPLKSWPATRHPRERDLEAFRREVVKCKRSM
jgi:muconolactone delta-isomerase